MRWWRAALFLHPFGGREVGSSAYTPTRFGRGSGPGVARGAGYFFPRPRGFFAPVSARAAPCLQPVCGAQGAPAACVGRTVRENATWDRTASWGAPRWCVGTPGLPIAANEPPPFVDGELIPAVFAPRAQTPHFAGDSERRGGAAGRRGGGAARDQRAHRGMSGGGNCCRLAARPWPQLNRPLWPQYAASSPPPGTTSCCGVVLREFRSAAGRGATPRRNRAQTNTRRGREELPGTPQCAPALPRSLRARAPCSVMFAPPR